MSSFLVIVEVSQKQAYIFSSNKLRDNIANSAIIAYVTSSSYFKEAAVGIYSEENEVYCGGGHAVLEFDCLETAKAFIRAITLDARKQFPGLELFATVLDCEGEPTADSLKALTEKLEKKKAVRRASFAQGTFGVEEVDAATRNVPIHSINGDRYYMHFDPVAETDRIDARLYPVGYERATAFDHLGGTEGESNFIAVVHIDGNAMGVRVDEICKKHGKKPWNEYKKILKAFSESIARDFTEAFREMCEVVAKNIHDRKLGSITLDTTKSGVPYFPVRRIITEGDDICFVSDGRIGIECARIFMELLGRKKNDVDGKSYATGAGVAIVHQKYPFYMAYDMAEKLCTNAKKYIANSTKKYEENYGKNANSPDASNVSAIDWHIEFGELDDTIEELREKYQTADGLHRMELRPYFISGPESYRKEERLRNYQNFRSVMLSLQRKENNYARGKIKEVRGSIREGEIALNNYLKANLLDELIRGIYIGPYEKQDLSKIGSGEQQECQPFVTTSDGISRSILFDAVESMDTFEPLEFD